MPAQHPKRPRPEPAHFKPWLDFWHLSLQAEGASERTRTIYLDVGRLFAGWLLMHAPEVIDWDQVGRDQLRRFFVWLRSGDQHACPHWLTRKPAGVVDSGCAGYGKGYANNVARALQQFFAWYAEEEGAPNPMLGLKVPSAPKPDEKLVPVLTPEQLGALIKDAEKARDFASRRDAAILRLFACAGLRLAELANLHVDHIDAGKREAVVTGKGSRQRRVAFDAKAAVALKRYLILREKHKQHALPNLWLGVRRSTALTPNGIYQLIARRGEALGIRLHPHMFRHTFAHNWLDAGGAEGDLMALTGWDSPQMLRHYGRSARSARALRAYDRVDVMRGV